MRFACFHIPICNKTALFVGHGNPHPPIVIRVCCDPSRHCLCSAIRHLYYARFIAHFLHDIGVLPCREPFQRFLPVGLVLGPTFVNPVSGAFVAAEDVESVKNRNGWFVWLFHSCTRFSPCFTPSLGAFRSTNAVMACEHTNT